jgi:CCR4-NOT transcription complex subunit 1
MSATAAARELRRASIAPEDPPGARDQVTALLEQWIRVWNESPGSEKAYAQYLALLQQHAVPRSDASTERFIRLATTICVESCVESRTIDGGLEVDGEAAGVLNYAVVDAYAKLLILLVKYAASDPNGSAAHAGAPVRLDLLNRVLSSLTRCLVADYDATAERGVFDQRPYFRLLLNLLQDLNVPDPVLDSSNVRVLAAFATVFHALQPAVAPGFAFSWLELVSHRMFMPNLLLAKNQRGWILMHRLLVDLFVFLEPYLRDVCLSDAVRLLYKGALRVLLVLLHDFPEFLSDYHFSFCDVIPSSCIQLRNLFLSAFPRSMRLPDPFTPNLKVDLLPEISVPPRILSNCVIALEACGLREPLDEYLQTRHPISFLLDLPRKLQTGIDVRVARDGVHATYNVPLVNALVVHVGTTAIAQLHAKSGSAQQPITHSTPMDVFQHLMNNLDSEGRYFLLNAIANQLRYPNNHTHYFSCVLLYLFAEATSEYVQEQVTRVLLERLIVHRPHPWGLLITFIELIKNPRYSFWSHGFTHCATEIERVFESVARSCMGPGHLSNTMDPAADN